MSQKGGLLERGGLLQISTSNQTGGLLERGELNRPFGKISTQPHTLIMHAFCDSNVLCSFLEQGKYDSYACKSL